MNKHSYFLILILFISSCLCEPNPDKRDYAGMHAAAYFGNSDTLSLIMGLEPTYSETPGKKKSGCTGYYEIDGFYFDDTLKPELVKLQCKDSIPGIAIGDDLLNTLGFTQYLYNHKGLPLSLIRWTLPFGKVDKSKLADTLHFEISSTSQKGKKHQQSLNVPTR